MKKNKQEEPIIESVNTFEFLKKEIESEKNGIKLISAVELKDPNSNKSGSFSLDYELSTPFPEGRIIELYGAEGSFKTTLALEVAGQACRAGKIVLYVNMERNLNPSLMRTIRSLRPFLDKALLALEKGQFDPNECPLWIVKASNGEEALNAMKKFASLFPASIAILDSVDASQPEAVIAGEIGENKMGNLSKLLSDAMRKLVDVVEANKVCLIFINQIRDKMIAYGDSRTTSGGNALKFYASQRIELMKPGKNEDILDDEGERIGTTIRFKVKKNKSAPDGNSGEIPILFNNGIFREQEVVTQCLNFGILKFGGKGGKQVVFPVLDKENQQPTEEFITMKQSDAARRLLIDIKLMEYLENELMKIMKPCIRDIIGEIQNSQQ